MSYGFSTNASIIFATGISSLTLSVHRLIGNDGDFIRASSVGTGSVFATSVLLDLISGTFASVTARILLRFFTIAISVFRAGVSIVTLLSLMIESPTTGSEMISGFSYELHSK